jgi:hypothetical protein
MLPSETNKNENRERKEQGKIENIIENSSFMSFSSHLSNNNQKYNINQKRQKREVKESKYHP